MTKILLGPAGSGGYSDSTIEGVDRLSGLGLQTLEVEFVHGVAMRNDLAKKIGAESGRLGVPLSVHAPYFVNLASKDPKKVDASKKRILDSCERMHHMGGGPVVFHPAFFGGMDKGKVFHAAKEAIAEMTEKIKINGWGNVRLAPETTGKHSALGSLDETMRLAEETGCSLCVDFAHLYARNNGKIDYAEIFDKLEPLKLKHLHTHFSGINYSAKGELNHITIDHGKPPFRPLAEEILGRKLGITIICESPVTYQDSIRMRKVFEGLGYRFP
jgi:deoxyribonuclease-4